MLLWSTVLVRSAIRLYVCFTNHCADRYRPNPPIPSPMHQFVTNLLGSLEFYLFIKLLPSPFSEPTVLSSPNRNSLSLSLQDSNLAACLFELDLRTKRREEGKWRIAACVVHLLELLRVYICMIMERTG